VGGPLLQDTINGILVQSIKIRISALDGKIDRFEQFKLIEERGDGAPIFR
jgi:hypothetical protein